MHDTSKLDINQLVSVKEKKELKDLLSNAENVTLINHYNPDSDGFASLIIMTYIIKNIYKKKTDTIFQGIYTKVFQDYAKKLDIELKCVNVPQHKYQYKDLLLVIDTNHTERTSAEYSPIDISQFNKFSIIDHHPALHQEDKHLSLRITKFRPSFSEVLFDIFEDEITSLDIKIQNTIIEILLYGILDDTKMFQIGGVSTHTFNTVSTMLKSGFNYYEFIQKFLSRPFEYYVYIGKLFEHIKFHKLGFGYIFLPDVDLPKDPDLRDFILNYFKNSLQKVDDRDMFIFFQYKYPQSDGTFKYSIRTRAKTTGMLRFVKELEDGGGHELSAGGNIYAKDDQEALQKVAEIFEKTMCK